MVKCENKRSHPKVLIIYREEGWSDLVSSLLQITASNDGAGTYLSGGDTILMPLSLPAYILENL